MDKPLIKMCGERNSGTNYLQKLTELNIDAELLSEIAPAFTTHLRQWLPGIELNFTGDYFRDE